MESKRIQDARKDFLKTFREMCYSRSAWQVWADLINAMACSLANATDRIEPRYSEREKEYAQCIERLGGVEKPAKCFEDLVVALESNPNQDFLGSLYMELELGNHWKGQFFTPYNICELMGRCTIGDGVKQKLREQKYISIGDSACGAGATLIAAANILRSKGINYQTDVVFVGQDVDRVVGMMCFIQLSILGCPGYVVIADTLTNPLCGSMLNPVEKEGQEFWYTPFFNTQIWQCRRIIDVLERITGNRKVPAEPTVPFRGIFLFEFPEENRDLEVPHDAVDAV